MRPILLLALSLAYAGCGDSSRSAEQGGSAAPAPSLKESAGRLDRSNAGAAAPEVLFQDPDGEPVSLADFRGKPLLVNLWATWCAPCVAEMPTLDALAGRSEDIEVLTVSQDLAGREKVDAFFAEHKYRNLEPYLDAEMDLMTQLKVDTLPATILYDAEGREVWRMTGMEDWQGSRAAKLIAEAS